MSLANILNNHLATVYAHPVNAARLQARGITPPIMPRTDIAAVPKITNPVIAFTQHFFSDNPQQPLVNNKTKG